MNAGVGKPASYLPGCLRGAVHEEVIVFDSAGIAAKHSMSVAHQAKYFVRAVIFTTMQPSGSLP
jgi:hypothetical protein